MKCGIRLDSANISILTQDLDCVFPRNKITIFFYLLFRLSYIFAALSRLHGAQKIVDIEKSVTTRSKQLSQVVILQK